jgi:UDP-N-acetylmuramoylalanine--D-glutamate ligase
MAKKAKGKVVWFSANDVPRGWKLKVLGDHNLENIAAAAAVGEVFGLSIAKIKKVVENFRGVPGRLEFVREVCGIKYYNDTTATMPEATVAALRAIGGKKIVLICGGADKNLNFKNLVPAIKKYTKTVVLLDGTATPKLQKQLLITNYQLPVTVAHSMREAVKVARQFATRGNIILLSPAAASFGMFKNEFDRGDQFLKEILKIR